MTALALTVGLLSAFTLGWLAHGHYPRWAYQRRLKAEPQHKCKRCGRPTLFATADPDRPLDDGREVWLCGLHLEQALCRQKWEAGE